MLDEVHTSKAEENSDLLKTFYFTYIDVIQNSIKTDV